MKTIALVGNPNSGKTTLFNLLTNSREYVGNYPGVTVEKKLGKINNGSIIIDLPGIYSLSSYSPEERIAQKYIIQEKPDLILNIIDGTNLERNLYLTLQLMEIGIPVVVAINMYDLLKKRGDKLNVIRLSDLLGVPVIPISALKSTGITSLYTAINSIKENKIVAIHRFEPKVEYVLSKIKGNRFEAVKIFQGDIKGNIQTELLVKECEVFYNDTRDSIIINQRYNYIEKILSQCYKKSSSSSFTNTVDLILTGKYTAIPLFIIFMTLIFYFSTSVFGGASATFIKDFLFDDFLASQIEGLLLKMNVHTFLIALINQGIVGGVGSVIAFVPQLSALFFFLCLLEDCGYMSRVAFIMDRIFMRFGLSGKCIIPLIVGTGCSVPAIMATRTLENRKSVIITTSFIPCSAKLPLIALVGGGFFSDKWYFTPIIYFAGIIAVLLSAIILQKNNITENPIAEIPPYHIPKLTVLLNHTWERIKSFLIKAGTVLVVVSALMWLMTNTGVLQIVSRFVAPVFAPLGFGYYQATSAVFAGLFAKENIVATLSVLGNYKGMFTPLSAMSFLLFNMFNSPCVMALVTMYRELNSKKQFLLGILYQNLFAYSVSFVVYQFGCGISFFTIPAVLLVLYFIYRIKRGLVNQPSFIIPC